MLCNKLIYCKFKIMSCILSSFMGELQWAIDVVVEQEAVSYPPYGGITKVITDN